VSATQEYCSHRRQLEVLREASGLLSNVLGSSEVKGQERIAKRINEAINQINIALSIR
jgi:hypothetical protein